MFFHIKFASAYENPVLDSMLIILIPNLIRIKDILQHDISKDRTYALQQHHKILEAVIKQDSQASGNAMAEHLSEMMSIRRKLQTV